MTSMSNTTQKHFIVEQFPLPTWVSDEKGLILYCNTECTKYWRDTSPPLFQQWLNFVYPADLEEVKNKWLDAIRFRSRIEFKCRLCIKPIIIDGVKFLFNCRNTMNLLKKMNGLLVF